MTEIQQASTDLIGGPTNTSGWLLNGLCNGEIFFASPNTQFRSQYAERTIHSCEPVSASALLRLFTRARNQGVETPILFGVVPFDTARDAHFSIPAKLSQTAIPDRQLPAAKPLGRKAVVLKRTPVPPPEVYGDMVREALKLYAQGGVDKIVLSRAMDIALDAPIQYEAVMEDLLRRNAHGYTFALPIWRKESDAPQVQGVMLGASPELLVRRDGDKVFINPLAGSIPRHSDPGEDASRREGLAQSEKDLREHGYVVRDIVRVLHEHCVDMELPDGPSVIGTDALWHLSTFITARLKDASMSALELACALHPTPAICGFPTQKAFEHIRALEPFDREYFAGLVGWQKESGDGEWALTLRCAQYDGDRQLRLYAGAGTVAGSDPDSEIRETATKMETFMRALV